MDVRSYNLGFALWSLDWRWFCRVGNRGGLGEFGFVFYGSMPDSGSVSVMTLGGEIILVVGGFAKLFGTLVLVVLIVCFADKRGW